MTDAEATAQALVFVTFFGASGQPMLTTTTNEATAQEWCRRWLAAKGSTLVKATSRSKGSSVTAEDCALLVDSSAIWLPDVACINTEGSQPALTTPASSEDQQAPEDLSVLAEGLAHVPLED